MLINLAQRSVDQTLFTRVCENFMSCLDHTERNSGRLFAYVIKNLKDTAPAEYRAIVCKVALAPLITDLGTELTKEIPDANK